MQIRRASGVAIGHTFGRESTFAVAAPQQQHAETVLDPRNHLAHRRGREIQIPGRGRKASVIHHAEKDQHLGVTIGRAASLRMTSA
jgi:hypothetical protein